MQFQVPQFIEVEDAIFGPLTFKQFIYVAGGAGIALIAWRTLPFIVALPIMGASVGLGAALAFIKYNDRPFILMLEHAFYFLINARLYLWDNSRRKARPEPIQTPLSAEARLGMPKLSESKLHELAWSLDIKERVRESDSGNNLTNL